MEGKRQGEWIRGRRERGGGREREGGREGRREGVKSIHLNAIEPQVTYHLPAA